MSTTSIIVEMLIIGFFTAVWLLLFCLRLSFFDIQEIKILASQIGSWTTPILFAAAALFYQLGLIMNTISYKLTERFAERKFRDQIVPGKVYENVKSTVWQKGSAELIRNLELNLTFVRLARAGIINFLLIAVVSFSFGRSLAWLGIISLMICIGCIPLWRGMYRFYYKRMGFAYGVIEELEKTATLTESKA
jgi:lysylphosphatidylglycerol synthetase-like protein (DUF2156 family)